MSKIREIVFFFVVVLLATPNIISAQEQDSGSRTLEEIIVTASKREVSSHDLPVSISALSEEGLKRIGAVGFADYLATMPGVSFPEVGAGRSAVLMRGVSTDADARTNLQNARLQSVDARQVH